MNRNTVFGHNYKGIPRKLSAMLRADSFVCALFDDDYVLQRVDAFDLTQVDVVNLDTVVTDYYSSCEDISIINASKPFMHSETPDDESVTFITSFQFKQLRNDNTGGVFTIYGKSPLISRTHTERHLSSLLLKSALVPEDTLVLGFGNGYIVAFQKRQGQLYYYNDFKCNTPEDYLYYVSMACDICQVDPLQQPLYVAGNIEPQGEIYKLLTQYVKDIRFLMPRDFRVSDPHYDNLGHVFFPFYLEVW